MLITTSLIVAMSVTVVVPCHNVSTSKLSAVCPENYTEVGDTCYEFHHEELVNYTTAASRCKNNGGGYLAMLEDAEERKLFNEFIQEQTYLHVKVKCPDMDVVFIFDTSSSNPGCAEGMTGGGDRYVQKMEKNVREHRKRSIEDTEDSTTDAIHRFAVVDAAGAAKVKIHFNGSKDINDFRDKLTNNITKCFLGYGQTPSKALEKIRIEVFGGKNSASDVICVVILFLEYHVWEFDFVMMVSESKKLQDGIYNCLVIVVHVNDGGKIDDMAYFNVSSDPPAQNTFHVEHISKLPNIISTLVTTSCGDLIKMWIGRSEDLGPTVTEGVMTTMNARFTSELRPKEECYRFVCEADKVWTEK